MAAGIASRRWLPLLISASLIASAFFAGAFYSAIGSENDTTYYACLTNGGTLSNVSTTGPLTCRNGQPIQWNATGPQGDTGEKGDKGDPGDGAALTASQQHTLELLDAERCGRLIRLQDNLGLVRRDFSYCDLSEMNLAGYNFIGNTLVGTVLTNTNLDSASFLDADLTDADLSGTNLFDTELSLANLTNANLLGAVNFDQASTAGATFCNTTMPDGSINNASCP